jgi:hypothetical protein
LVKAEDTGEAFLREVDDEYRRAKLGTLVSRYGRLALLGVGLLLVAVAGWLYWRGQRAAQADTRAQSLAEALTDVRANQAAKANAILAKLATAPEPGYRALAVLEQAGIAATSGDTARAASLYNSAAANTDLAMPFRDLATIKATQIEFDTLPPAIVIARLRAMALPGNPWFGTAGELTALAQMKAGHPELARPLFETIARDETVPPSLRGRVQQVAASLPAPGSRAVPSRPLAR